jgi:hypothetical protein
MLSNIPATRNGERSTHELELKLAIIGKDFDNLKRRGDHKEGDPGLAARSDHGAGVVSSNT